MPGRKPKPTVIKELSGNPGKRKLNKSEPTFNGTPTCPKHLDAEAKKEWKRVSKELSGSGLLTSVDRAALAAYCSSWSRWANAEEQIQKFGAVIKSPKSGFPIQNPYVGIANTALDQMRKYATEFGMTPSSRSRLSIPGKPAKSTDAFTRFMSVADEHAPDDITETIQ